MLDRMQFIYNSNREIHGVIQGCLRTKPSGIRKSCLTPWVQMIIKLLGLKTKLMHFVFNDWRSVDCLKGNLSVYVQCSVSKARIYDFLNFLQAYFDKQ